jgi:hypothetical protein
MKPIEAHEFIKLNSKKSEKDRTDFYSLLAKRHTEIHEISSLAKDHPFFMISGLESLPQLRDSSL